MASFDPVLAHKGLDRFANIEQYLVDNPITAGGSVTNVSSANSAITVANPTTTPVLTFADPGTSKVWGSDGAGHAAAVFPPGYEISYDQITSNVNVTGTASGSQTTVITGTSHTYSNIPYIVEFFAPQVILGTSSGMEMLITLTDGGAPAGYLAILQQSDTTTNGSWKSVVGKYRLTPSAGAHTYGVSAWVTSTTGTPSIHCGAAGSGIPVPAFLRITQV